MNISAKQMGSFLDDLNRPGNGFRMLPNKRIEYVVSEKYPTELRNSLEHVFSENVNCLHQRDGIDEHDDWELMHIKTLSWYNSNDITPKEFVIQGYVHNEWKTYEYGAEGEDEDEEYIVLRGETNAVINK